MSDPVVVFSGDTITIPAGQSVPYVVDDIPFDMWVSWAIGVTDNAGYLKYNPWFTASASTIGGGTAPSLGWEPTGFNHSTVITTPSFVNATQLLGQAFAQPVQSAEIDLRADFLFETTQTLWLNSNDPDNDVTVAGISFSFEMNPNNDGQPAYTSDWSDTPPINALHLDDNNARHSDDYPDDLLEPFVLEGVLDYASGQVEDLTGILPTDGGTNTFDDSIDAPNLSPEFSVDVATLPVPPPIIAYLQFDGSLAGNGNVSLEYYDADGNSLGVSQGTIVGLVPPTAAYWRMYAVSPWTGPFHGPFGGGPPQSTGPATLHIDFYTGAPTSASGNTFYGYIGLRGQLFRNANLTSRGNSRVMVLG